MGFNRILLVVLLGHFAVRQFVTAGVSRNTKGKAHARYIDGRGTLVTFWVCYLVVFGGATFHLAVFATTQLQWAGYAILLIGTGLRIAALRSITGYYFANISVSQSHKVINQGPYRILRHPLSLGLNVEVVGLWFIAGFQWWLSPAVLVLALEIQRNNMREQSLLSLLLGEDYLRFASRTWDTSDLRVVQWPTAVWAGLVKRHGRTTTPF